MTYSIEKSRNLNLEDTAIPNLFITDFLPDAPDGDFVKVYIYAYMCCRQGIALTHTELAERVGLTPEKVIAAWRYFSDRRIVKLTEQTQGDAIRFDVEFVDLKGVLYVKEKPNKRGGETAASGAKVSSLSDPELAALFGKIAVACGSPSIGGADARRVISWIDEYGATPEIVEFAFVFCVAERGEKSVKYVGKVVKEWASQGLKTVSDVRDYRAKTDARSGAHKKLMEALGLRYSVITAAEEKKFNLWLDDYGYTIERLLELADKTAGVGNKLKYLGGIIRKEREAEGKSTAEGDGVRKRKPGNTLKDRNEYYRKKRQRNEDEAAARREEVYAALPEIKKGDDEISLLNIELVKTLTSGMKDKQSAVDRLNSDIEKLSNARAALLEENGYAKDYMDVRSACLRCSDTGVLENGASCDCYAV